MIINDGQTKLMHYLIKEDDLWKKYKTPCMAVFNLKWLHSSLCIIN